jgi:hypothetical protein
MKIYRHTITRDLKPKIIHEAAVRLSSESFADRISDGAPTTRTVLFMVASAPLCGYGNRARNYAATDSYIITSTSILGIIHPTFRPHVVEILKPS